MKKNNKNKYAKSLFDDKRNLKDYDSDGLSIDYEME